ncbi:4-hydroxybenzoate octaprenyltransferase [Sedimenticola selenatireducens]|uniref:4-hydroxybenzoate octaprenyltransferase n=1 Tax=Sedimenticola selenatireducens TaxID=191960 RepID=A0A558DYZ6_9GAMM|nr:4-hydroxybenzoate octaprenyltransferase [Sedimenticola selenatireducens]TVO71932.1 4-hydroxybenzoate octaprenyltransferase [Sedimenticola selenatireducens]TVT66312.1 MAG: 4-hydroxybenzoate octaprenyltransferase [Sedimenticola selenatireducens]
MNHPEFEIKEVMAPRTWQQQFDGYIRLIRLDKPIGILLLLWPALWALWMAGAGQPRWGVVLIFILGVALMRSAGCAINDYADRHFDGEVARTCGRPLATGLVSPKEALWIFAILCLIAFGLVLLLNQQTVVMSFVAVLLAALYPFMKRFTHLPQLVLGMAFGWAVPMAYMALTEAIPLIAWVLYVATIVWALIYDTEYAMVDRDDDLRIGVKSTAILFGRYDRLIIGLLQLVMIGLMITVGIQVGLGLYYYLGLTIASLLFVRQQQLISNREPAACFTAFLNNNCVGMMIFFGLLLDYFIG